MSELPRPAAPLQPPGGGPRDAASLGGEDAKLITLARAARARAAAIEGAAVRDQDGRTYAAATVALPSLSLSALQLAVANAAAAGATSLEAAAVVTEGSAVDGGGCAAVRDLSRSAPVHMAAPDGTVFHTLVPADHDVTATQPRRS